MTMTTADAQFYWANHHGGAAWIAEYRGTVDVASRQWALEAVRTFGLARSVLEIGCHCGPLLRQLAALPGIRDVYGLDINAEAVAAAREDGLTAIVGGVPEALTRLSTRSIDVIVSSYCLAYVAPIDLPRTLGECLRIARMGLVLIEPSAGPGVDSAVFTDGKYVEWRHEYLDALARARRRMPIAPAVEVTRTRKSLDALNAIIVAKLNWPT